MYVCEVQCCRSSQDPNRTYHRFPNDTARCKEWLKILGKKSTDLRHRSVVCSRHFRFKDYYSGGKRLMPSAIPVLRLSNSSKKDKSSSKVRQSEANRQKNISDFSPKRKSVPNITSNKFQEVKQLPKLLKNSSKSDLTLNSTSGSKQLVNHIVNLKNEKPEKDKLLNAESSKEIVKKNLKHNEISGKPASNLDKRSLRSVNKYTLSRSRQRLLRDRKDNNNSPLKTKDVRKPSAKLINKKNAKIGLSTLKKCSSDIVSQSQLSSKLEGTEDDAKFKKSIDSEEMNTSKSPSGNAVNGSKITSLSGKDSSSRKRNLETSELESKTRRSIKKRKRLLSEDNCDSNNIGTVRPKVSSCKINRPNSVLTTKLKQTKTSTSNASNKNLSGIEKTILEMQNKIQMLEKKSILDEKRIENFKKALITQRNTDLQILMDEKENELLLRMDLLYLDYDPYRICRLCLQLVDRKEDLIPLFWPLKNQALISLIRQATSIEVELEDGMPSGICEECLEDIRRIDWLKRRTQKSNSLIKKFVNLKKSSSQNNTEIFQVITDTKLKSNDHPSEEEVTDEFKIEDVFSLENSPISFETITVKQEIESDEESKLTNNLNTTYSIAVKKPQKVQRCGNCNKVFKNPWIRKIHFQYCSKRFQCSECNKCFSNAAVFRKHKQTMYSCFCAENLRYCSDCNISFRWKWQLVFHVLRHSTEVCVLCNDTLYSREHLKRHFNEVHADY